MRTRPVRPFRAAMILLGAGAAGSLSPSVASGQEFQALVAECAGEGGETILSLCHQAALALETARSGLGASAALGSDVPGAGSTFGHRLRGFPRTVFSARGALSRISLTRLPGSYLPSPAPARDETHVPSVHFTGTVGVLDGFSPTPTVGGVLSLDLSASLHGIFPPGGDGFKGSIWGWGLGGRVGLFRESFTLPGISFTATRRWMGAVKMDGDDPAGPAEARGDMTVTSYRGVLGKDLAGVGFLAGMGWDRISGDGSIVARTSAVEPDERATVSGLSSKRRVFFAGISKTFLILQVSGEVGWSEAVDPELGLEPEDGSTPSNDVILASLAFRVTF